MMQTELFPELEKPTNSPEVAGCAAMPCSAREEMPDVHGAPGTELPVKYANGWPVRMGDKCRVGNAECTIRGVLLAPDRTAQYVVVDIAGIPLDGGHGVCADRFPREIVPHIFSQNRGNITKTVDKCSHRNKNHISRFCDC